MFQDAVITIKPFLILLEYTMGGDQLKDIIKEMRESFRGVSYRPYIIVYTESNSDVKDTVLNAGVDLYIGKPENAESMIAAVKEYLDNQEAEKEKRLHDFQGFQVDTNLISKAKDDVLVMHCLPAHRGEEISPKVADGLHSIIFEQAHNRLHVQKAILVKTLLLSP